MWRTPAAPGAETSVKLKPPAAEMAWKASLRLQKLFVAEVERADRLDREGEQVLSSLANVSQRLPLLLSGGHEQTASEAGADATLGVLAFSEGTRERLLLRHFAALDKSRGFLTSVMRDYGELVTKLQALLNDLLQAQTEILDQDGGSDGALGAMRRLEWMEDVARMLQRELVRKQRLVELVEYHDATRLASIHAQWPSRSRWGNVAAEYVRAGLEPPPALPKAVDAASDGDGDKKSGKKKQKQRQKKKN